MILVNSLAVLWSPNQNAFSVETVDEMLRTNLAIFADGTKGDYIVLGFAENQTSAREIADRFMAERDKRLAIANSAT